MVSLCAELVAERVGLWDKLSAMFGRSTDVTVFAPSNDAFDRLPATLQQQLLNGRHSNDDACVTSNAYNIFTPQTPYRREHG